MIRVLRIYHSAVVPEYRERDRLLRSRHGYDVQLVTPPAWEEGGSIVRAITSDDDPVRIVPVRGRREPILFWYESSSLRRLLREVRPHIVDLHEEPYSLAVASALTAVARHAPEAKVCMYSAQNIFKRYPPPFRWLEQRALKRASAMYPCSSEVGDVLRAKGYAGTLRVIPLGVKMEPRPERRFNSQGTLRVGFVGRLEPYKGGDLAIEAFALATEDLDASLEIVGAGTQRDELVASAVRLGVDSRVSFSGAVPQDEALARIASYDVLLVPSRTTRAWKEQFGRIVVQAFEAGTPVVASDSGSLREVVGGDGELVAEGDAATLGDRLRRLLRDPALRSEMSARGRARAAADFAWEHVADEFDAMYRGVLSLPTR